MRGEGDRGRISRDAETNDTSSRVALSKDALERGLSTRRGEYCNILFFRLPILHGRENFSLCTMEERNKEEILEN